MRAWVFVATAALFHTQACGSADYGDKIGSPTPTDSSRSPEKSSDYPKGQPASETTQKEAAGQEEREVLEITKTAKNVGHAAHSTTASPQEPFRQHLELPQNVNSLYPTSYEDNSLAALYEATRNAYVDSSRSSLYSHPSPQFHQPLGPFNEPYPRLHPYTDPVETNLLAQPAPYNRPPSAFYHPQHNARSPHPFQNNKIQETSFVGFNRAVAGQNNFDDYDDGSYDPYKYGDYIYFDDDYSQNHQKPHASSAALSKPYQQPEASFNNLANQLSTDHQTPNNHLFSNHQNNKVQREQQSQQLSPVAPTSYQQSQPLYNPNNQHGNNYFYLNNQHNSNHQQNVQQHHQKTFQSQIQHQSHSPVHPKKTVVPTNSNDGSKSLDDSYSYQVEAATQYLKEIEEQQEYAKKVLAASKSPALPPQSSQNSGNFDFYDYQNKHTSSDGRYNNFPLESNNYQQTAHPAHQPSEESPVGSLLDQQSPSDSHGGHFEDAPASYVDGDVPAGGYPSGVSPVPTAAPVLLPNGFLADTEEVRLAKIAHLQLVLDTIKTMTTYRRQYAKRRVVNAL